VLVAPTAHAAAMLSDPTLQHYRGDLEIVTPMPAAGDKPTGPVVLIRPDGHIAAQGKPGSMDAVTSYLRDLFREPSNQQYGPSFAVGKSAASSA
jgi:hypothetical protein